MYWEFLLLKIEWVRQRIVLLRFTWKKSDKHSPQKINTEYLQYNIVMSYLVFIFCSVNKLCLNFMHCFTYWQKNFKETFERITLTVNNKILFYRIEDWGELTTLNMLIARWKNSPQMSGTDRLKNWRKQKKPALALLTVYYTFIHFL